MKIKRNNQGQIEKNFLLVILGVIIIIVVLYLLGNYYFKIKDKIEVQDCKDSIAAHSLLASESKREIFTDIKCPTRYITIKPQDIDKTKEIIAEDMHRCWYEWNQGKGQYFEGDGVFCHVCAVYDFSNKDQKIDGFMKYLYSTPIKVTWPGDKAGITYEDYFEGYSTAKASTNTALNVESKKIPDLQQYDELNTSKKYASIIVYASGKGIEKFLEGYKTSLATGGGIAVIIGGVGAGAGTIGLAGSFGSALIAGTLNSWNPVGWVILTGVGVAAIGIGVAALYTSIVAASKDPQYISVIVFQPYTAENIKNLGCEQAPVNQLSNSAPTP